jgi:hypothetical protein
MRMVIARNAVTKPVLRLSKGDREALAGCNLSRAVRHGIAASPVRLLDDKRVILAQARIHFSNQGQAGCNLSRAVRHGIAASPARLLDDKRVILAQARIHFQTKVKMDSGLRRNDGPHPSPWFFLRVLRVKALMLCIRALALQLFLRAPSCPSW